MYNIVMSKRRYSRTLNISHLPLFHPKISSKRNKHGWEEGQIIVNFDEKTELQKQCDPGPKVEFIGKNLPFYAYLKDLSKDTSELCKDGKFPTYVDGKYCCVDEKPDEQEQLDFVNYLLEQSNINVAPSVFNKNIRTINYLLQKRKKLMRNEMLEDSCSFRDDVNGWFQKQKDEADKISSFRPDPDDSDVKGGNKKKKNKSKKLKNKKARKSRKKYE